MYPNKALIIFGHVLFWVICSTIQISLSSESLVVDLLSTLAFSVAFYINYFIVLPLMPKKRPDQGMLFSLALYLLISVTQIYPLYELLGDWFKQPEIVGKGHRIGSILHLSFFFYSISSMSKLMIDKMIRDKQRHMLSIKQVDANIQKIRNELSFNYTGTVLTHLQKEAKENPESVVKPIGTLSKVMRYKLHKSKSESTLLSDELKIIQQYLDLIAETKNGYWKAMVRDDDWIPIGAALKEVEEFIKTTPKKAGTIMVSADGERVWINVK